MTSRTAPINLSSDEFRSVGHELIDRIAELLETIADRPVTSGLAPEEVRDRIDSRLPLPDAGMPAPEIVARTTELLTELSLYNGHPRFGGYITSSPAPIGMLADLLAAAINPNVGGWTLSPAATEIEAQTVRWIAELLGYPTNCGGLLVSGGNMANISCLIAARTAKADYNIREHGMYANGRMLVYASSETHTWLQKATDMLGMGTDSIRWIEVDSAQRIDLSALRAQVEADRESGDKPFCVVAGAGTVSTGVIDPLYAVAELCREFDLWMHVDGAYGGFGAVLPELADLYHGLSRADSIAVDPHKWLYAPLEAGCVLVRDVDALRNAFSYHPAYYHFGQEATNYVDFGPQNSRGFRALKVWMSLKQVGRSGYEEMIRDDCRLARLMYDEVSQLEEFDALSCSLSIATFQFVPPDLREKLADSTVHDYLNELNTEIQDRLERSGEAFVSNAVIGGRYCLRMCIVNFRTSEDDIRAIVEIIRRLGHKTDADLRPADLR